MSRFCFFLRLYSAFIFLFFSFGLMGQTEVKFNAATALALIPNFGVELPLGAYSSAQLDVLGSFWDSVDTSAYHLTQIFPEYRLYSQSGRHGWFAGAHVGFGMFTMRKPNFPGTYGYPKGYYQSGRISFTGISLGYKKTLSSRWAWEVFIGGGRSHAVYRNYRKSDWTRWDSAKRQFNKSSEWVLYRGGVMVVYKIRGQVY